MSWKQTETYLESVKEDFEQAYEEGNLVRCMVLFDELKDKGFDDEASALLAEKSEKSLMQQLSRPYYEESERENET